MPCRMTPCWLILASFMFKESLETNHYDFLESLDPHFAQSLVVELVVRIRGNYEQMYVRSSSFSPHFWEINAWFKALL